MKLNTENLYPTTSTDMIQIIGFNSNVDWNVEILDHGGDVGLWSSFKLDSKGYPHISYYDVTNTALKYTKWNGSAWITETVDSTNDVGKYSSLGLDSNDYPHISFYNETSDGLMYTKWNGTAWVNADGTTHGSEVVDTLYSTGTWGDLALGTDDYPRITYNFYMDSDDDIAYTEWNGSAWVQADGTTPGREIIISGFLSATSRIALDSNNYAHVISNFSNNSNISFTKWNGTAWVQADGTTPGDEIIGTEGGSVAIAVKSDDHPIICYNTKVKEYNGSSWDVETLPESLSNPSLKLDSNQLPCISYVNSGIKYTNKLSNNYWKIVDIDSNFGTTTSLALDSNDTPHVSYYNSTNDDLMYSSLSIGNILLFNSIDESSSFKTNSVKFSISDYDNKGIIASISNNHLHLIVNNEDNTTGVFDDQSNLLRLYYNYKITTTETIPTLALTDMVVSSNFIENADIDLRIQGNSKTTTDVVKIGNSIYSNYKLFIESITATNGINGEDKTAFNTIEKTIIDDTNTLTNTVSEINHSIFDSVNLTVGSSKSLNGCTNDVFIGFINSTATASTGNYNS
jgi:hypothetical protein